MRRGALGLVNLGMSEGEPYVTQGSEGKLLIVGSITGQHLALSVANQLILMRAMSERFDEYETFVAQGLRRPPLRVVAHPQKLAFLVQEDALSVALWDVLDDRCLWRECFHSEISCLNLWDDRVLVGTCDGEVRVYQLVTLPTDAGEF
jgi:hypothetical protein